MINNHKYIYVTFEVCLIFQEIGIDWNHQVSVIDHHGHLVRVTDDHLDGNDDHVDMVVFAHEPYLPNGMYFHLLHDSMYIEYHHQTEIDICLKYNSIVVN